VLTPVWPSAYWLDDDRLMSGHEVVVRLGETIFLIGGSFDYDSIRDLMTNPMPDQCLQSSVFWVAHGSAHSTLNPD